MSNNVPPGLMQPTMASYTPGAGNPRESALMAGQNAAARQATLNNSVGGKKRRKYMGGANSVQVPQFQMQYNDVSGPGSGPNDQIKSTSSTSMQSAANSINDNLATKKGGATKKRKGGNPNWLWPCYSGGKKRSNRRKSLRNKKRSRRHKR